MLQPPLAWPDDPLGWTPKGTPPAFEGLQADAVGAAGVHLFDDRLLFPAAVLRGEVVEANGAWMRAFAARAGAELAPHGKTTMAPALFQRQFDDGAWGLTAATTQHVRSYRRFGVRRILMANQLVGAGEIDWVFGELRRAPEFEFYCLVDSVAGVEALARHGDDAGGRTIGVLVEAGREGGRAGVRTVEEGMRVARAAAEAGHGVRLAGVETYEGVAQSAPDGLAEARVQLAFSIKLAQAIEDAGLFGDEVLLTAGGSSFFDLAAEALAAVGLARATRVLRSGCYLTHDDGLYERLYAELLARDPGLSGLKGGLRPALQVWAHVLSRPEPGRVICGLGKRDVGADADLPRPVAWARPGERLPRAAPDGLTTAALYDQHLTLDGPADMPFAVGDLVGFGVSHPCTTFDKWRALLWVDADWRVQQVIRTFF